MKMLEPRDHRCSRRQFLTVPLLLAFSGGLSRFGRRIAALRHTEHPDPRPGITAEHVLPAEHFKDGKIAKAYDMAREIPEVLDGLYCHCDCSKSMHHRSLLSCFESEQPSGCGMCQEEMRLAYRLHKDGKTLEEIRKAVDAKYE